MYYGVLNFIFCRDNTNCRCIWFSAFQILEKWANLRLPLNVKKSSVSASGGFALTLLTRGSTPGLCWGAVYRGLTVAFGGLQFSSGGTD